MRQPLPKPAQRIESAQTTWAVLEIRLEVVGRIVVTRVPRIAFGQACKQIFVGWPHARRIDDGAKACVQ
jgi:hypothetical protein